MDPVGWYLLLMVQKSQTTTWDVENFVIHGINYHINWCRISSINSCKWIISPGISIGVSPLNRLQTNEVVTNFHGHPSTSSAANGINLANHQTCMKTCNQWDIYMIFIYIIAGFLSIKCITPLFFGIKALGRTHSFSAIYVGDRNIHLDTKRPPSCCWPEGVISTWFFFSF